jgi:hypothetical protein
MTESNFATSSVRVAVNTVLTVSAICAWSAVLSSLRIELMKPVGINRPENEQRNLAQCANDPPYRVKTYIASATALVIADTRATAKILLKTEGFFVTDLEGTEADSSEMSGCGEWAELSGGHDDVFSRLRSALIISGPIWGIMLFLLILKMSAGVLKHNRLSVEQNTKLLHLFLVRPVEGLFEVAVFKDFR